MVAHGWLKLIGGEHVWAAVGANWAGTLGIHSTPVVWGLIVALCQTLCGALIAIGFLARPAALVLAFVMAVAAPMAFQLSHGDFKLWSHPAEAAVTCLAIFMMGTGRFALQKS